MNALIAVQVKPTQWYWRDLPEGYLILGDVAVADDRSFADVLMPDPAVAYVDPRTGTIHRYRDASDGVAGHFEYDTGEILDLLGYTAISEAVTGRGTVRIRFDLPNDPDLRAMTQAAIETTLGLVPGTPEAARAQSGGITVSGRALRTLMLRLFRIGHGRTGGVQVHDLIPNLTLKIGDPGIQAGDNNLS